MRPERTGRESIWEGWRESGVAAKQDVAARQPGRGFKDFNQENV